MIKRQSIVNTLLRFIVIGSLMSAAANYALANDGDRITQLESEVQYLKQRLSSLEKQLGSPVVLPKPLAFSDGWKNLANWRAIKNGMSPDEVRSVLGEPATVRASGTFTYWSYSNRGTVDFHQDRLYGWTEPR